MHLVSACIDGEALMHLRERGWATVVMVVHRTDGLWRRNEARWRKSETTLFLRFCIPKQILNRGVKITQECMHTHTQWQTGRKANEAAWKSVALQIICWPSMQALLHSVFVSRCLSHHLHFCNLSICLLSVMFHFFIYSPRLFILPIPSVLLAFL